MTTLRFTKMHGAGNDFVVLDGIRDELPPLEPIASQIAHRHFGVGFDQLLVVRPPSQAARSSARRDASPQGARAEQAEVEPRADFRMEIFNADGSQVEMCANGIRCFFKYLRDAGHTSKEEVRVETLSGVVIPRWLGGDGREARVTVDMGPPVLAPAKIPTTLGDASGDGPVLDVPLEALGETLTVSSLSMGNPHCITRVDDVDAFPVERFGPAIETHPAFPNRVNVEFVQLVSRSHLRQRSFERGTGETLACGSGACAVAVASMLSGIVDPVVRIELRGGDLSIAWEGGDSSVFMTGPAATIFTGSIELQED